MMGRGHPQGISQRGGPLQQLGTHLQTFVGLDNFVLLRFLGGLVCWRDVWNQKSALPFFTIRRGGILTHLWNKKGWAIISGNEANQPRFTPLGMGQYQTSAILGQHLNQDQRGSSSSDRRSSRKLVTRWSRPRLLDRSRPSKLNRMTCYINQSNSFTLQLIYCCQL